MHIMVIAEKKKKNENIIDTKTHPDLIRYRCRVLLLKCIPCFLVVFGDGSKDIPSLVQRPGSSLATAVAIVRFSFLGLSVNILKISTFFNSQPQRWLNNKFDV